ncbi:MAG: helix-turn-helix protein, partial [uncultured bacterium (gcode 4)]
MKNQIIVSAYDFINSASEETKQKFELDDILYDISMRIFDYRIENNLKQNELAKILGVTQAMISKLESGTYNPTIESLWTMSKKLDFDFEIVFKSKNAVGRAEIMWQANSKSEKVDCKTIFNKVST